MNQAQTLPGIGDLVDGRFRIDRKLGEGGTSTVYEVSHVITDKKFAIKWLLPELALEDAAVHRFIHEARVGGKFAHPLAVQVYDICKANDSFYMLMELLQGESLQARLERVGRLSVQEACAIAITCGDVLSAAHRVGIVHRDLKPANIFLCNELDGHGYAGPKLLDFGISTFYSDLHSISLTATPRGSVIGTPLYMSPEQMLSQPVDPRTDIYALGAVLYELVSGQPPYEADSYAELVVKVTVEAKPTPLDWIAPVDRQFMALVAKAMARRPEDRFATVDELVAALRSYVDSIESSSIRAISAAAKPQLFDTRPTRPRLLRGPRWLSGLSPHSVRAALWAGLVALGGTGVAAVGARYLDRQVAHRVSPSSPWAADGQTAELTGSTSSTALLRASGSTWQQAADMKLDMDMDMDMDARARGASSDERSSEQARGSEALPKSKRQGGDRSVAPRRAGPVPAQAHANGRHAGPADIDRRARGAHLQPSSPAERERPAIRSGAGDHTNREHARSLGSHGSSDTQSGLAAGRGLDHERRAESHEPLGDVSESRGPAGGLDPAAKVRIRRSDFIGQRAVGAEGVVATERGGPPDRQEPEKTPPQVAVSRDDF